MTSLTLAQEIAALAFKIAPRVAIMLAVIVIYIVLAVMVGGLI